jgi:hypothetical protein
MTMRTTMPIASRRAFVGLGSAFLQPPFQHRREALCRNNTTGEQPAAELSSSYCS